MLRIVPCRAMSASSSLMYFLRSDAPGIHSIKLGINRSSILVRGWGAKASKSHTAFLQSSADGPF